MMDWSTQTIQEVLGVERTVREEFAFLDVAESVEQPEFMKEWWREYGINSEKLDKIHGFPPIETLQMKDGRYNVVRKCKKCGRLGDLILKPAHDAREYWGAWAGNFTEFANAWANNLRGELWWTCPSCRLKEYYRTEKEAEEWRAAKPEEVFEVGPVWGTMFVGSEERGRDLDPGEPARWSDGFWLLHADDWGEDVEFCDEEREDRFVDEVDWTDIELKYAAMLSGVQAKELS